MIPYLTVDHVSAISDMGVAGAAIFAAWQGIKSLSIWRNERVGTRRIDLAEDALAAIYEAQNALRMIRSPFGYIGEADGRDKPQDESAAQKRLRDTAYIAFERAKKHQEKFDQLHLLSVRVKAIFGAEYAEPLERVRQTIDTVRIAASSLFDVPHEGFNDRDFVRQLEEDVWAMGKRDLNEGKIGKEIADCISNAEKLFGPHLQRNHSPQKG